MRSRQIRRRSHAKITKVFIFQGVRSISGFVQKLDISRSALTASDRKSSIFAPLRRIAIIFFAVCSIFFALGPRARAECDATADRMREIGYRLRATRSASEQYSYVSTKVGISVRCGGLGESIQSKKKDAVSDALHY